MRKQKRDFYFEVYLDKKYLVASYETQVFTEKEAVAVFIEVMKDIDCCVNKEDFAVAKATLKKLRDNDYYLEESLFSDFFDTVIVNITEKELEYYF